MHRQSWGVGVSGNEWSGVHQSGGVHYRSGGNERSGVYDRSGVHDWSQSGAVHNRGAAFADGGWYGAHDGGAVDSWGQEAWTGGGNSQESGQHHQFEHVY